MSVPGEMGKPANGLSGLANCLTIAGLAKSKEIWQEILSFHQDLVTDDYTRELDSYYRQCVENFGSYWVYYDIVSVLYTISRVIQPAEYLEVGVRRGRSVCAVAQASPDVNISAFDMWQKNYAGMENPGPEFVQSELKKFSHRGQVDFFNGNSHETLPQFVRDNPEKKFDLITVDGDHTPEGALQDLRDVIDCLRPGGYIVFDDIAHPSHPELGSVWQDFVKEQGNLKSWDYKDDGYGVAFARKDKES